MLVAGRGRTLVAAVDDAATAAVDLEGGAAGVDLAGDFTWTEGAGAGADAEDADVGGGPALADDAAGDGAVWAGAEEAIISKRVFSSIIFVPCLAAASLFNFPPSFPRRRYDVLLLTEPVTRPP